MFRLNISYNLHWQYKGPGTCLGDLSCSEFQIWSSGNPLELGYGGPIVELGFLFTLNFCWCLYKDYVSSHFGEDDVISMLQV